MRGIFAIAFALLLAGQLHAENAPRVYMYTIDISNAADPGMQNAITERIAKALGKSSAQCVDLRMLGSSNSGELLNKGSAGIVMNAPLSAKTMTAIRRAVCAQKNKLPKEFISEADKAQTLAAIQKCRVKISMKSSKLSETKVAFTEVKDGDSKTTSYSLEDKPYLPQMSEACNSGKRQDSWNDAGSTQGARLLIAGTNGAAKFNTFGLTGDGIDWTFGFPSKDTFSAVESLSRSNIKTQERAAHSGTSD